MTRGATVQNNDQGMIVNVPLRLKKRGGRKEVILPQAFASDTPMYESQQEALVVALARAHRWQRLLDEGRLESITGLAREVGMDVSLVARLMRLTLLAPDIIEGILVGEEPSGLSLTQLTKAMPVVWNEQCQVCGTSGGSCLGAN